MPHANACVLALRQVSGCSRAKAAAAATLEIGMLPTVAASLAPALMKALAERWRASSCGSRRPRTPICSSA